ILLLDKGQGGLSAQLPAMRALGGKLDYLQVSDPQTALELLGQRSIGVVVADFGGDTDDCVRFFQSAAALRPAAIRVAFAAALADLTGGLAERGPHQCLSSGCSADQMHAVLLRCSDISARIQRRPDLVHMLSRLDVIPTPPAVYFDIRDALEHETTTLNSLVDLVQRDAALAAKVLKVANSGFFGAQRCISDLAAAIRLVGMELLMAVALTSHLLQCMPLPGLQLDRLWLHGLAVSTLARFIARDEKANHDETEVAGVAGLLHDIGGLLLLGNFPADYQHMLRQSAGDEVELLELEQSRFGVGHPELGALLLELWNLPDAVVRAVEMHHVAVPRAQQPHGLAAYAVFMAETLLQDLQRGADRAADDSAVSELSSIDEEKFASWRERCPVLLRACGGV
ncbi:MAG: HDOD domain-containing protein, partial [Sedimenticolaceae bacterium]